ncbi:MAG: hypothetical protein LBV80_09040 [Deltaproteobacteria bacterium]|jgi:flagellar hook-associated protein 3 FlgL|nr:hypothetical protein [Deltaproteobacteria bacterium]
MAIRVSQRQIFANMIGGMNGSLTTLMDLHAQDTSQKKVNKPSDDPYAAAQILASNNTLASIRQYKDNLSMARGWISQADNALSLVDEELVALQTILQQGATTELTPDQRRALGTRARSILDQLISYANTPFSGRSIFAGHKTDGNAYERVPSAHFKDPNLSDVKFKTTGNNETHAVIQFTEDGTLTTDADGNLTGSNPAFRYSLDGGKNWLDGSWETDPSGQPIMRAGPVTLQPLVSEAATTVDITAVDTTNEHENGNGIAGDPHEYVNGTWIYVSPSAQYMGDTNDATVTQVYPVAVGAPNVAGIQGKFNHDVAVRVDDVDGSTITYSYSLDNGGTWVEGNTSDTLDLHVPGGVLTLGAAPRTDDQFVIRPYKADIEMNIGNNASIVVNNVGLNAFGGLYEAPFSEDGAQPVEGPNMFELVSRAISAFESNSQQGCQEVLGELKDVMGHVVNFRTMAGSRINRIESIGQQLEYLEYDESDHLSALEDADLSELLSKISAQQLAYNSILKTSSMIMQMSLMNFL